MAVSRCIWVVLAVGLLLTACSGLPADRATPLAATAAVATARPPGPSRVASSVAATAVGTPPVGAATIFTMLATNRLLAFARDGSALADLTLAAPSPAARSSGQFLALSRDGRRLFALAPGTPERVVVLDVATFATLASYPLPPGDDIVRSLLVGPATGRLYLVGNRAAPGSPTPATSAGMEQSAAGVVVTVLDPDGGRVVATWTARAAAGHDWFVYQAALAADERQLFLSYHGTDTTGIDRFALTETGLARCTSAGPPNVGCLRAHGPFALYGDGLLLQHGDESLIYATDQEGQVRRTFDTQLVGNHMVALAVDARAERLYAVGDCSYVPGYSVLDLSADGPPTTTATPATPFIAPTAGDGPPPCGSQLALGPAGLVVVGQSARPEPDPLLPGKLLLLDGRTGGVDRTVVTPAAPIDVLVVPAP